MSKSKMIGNRYEGASVLSIMQNLRAKGPLVIDFEPTAFFSLYKTGIIKEDDVEIVD